MKDLIRLIAIPKLSQLVWLFFIPMSVLCFGQTPGLGSWNIVNLKWNASKRISFFGEAQLRSLKFYDHFHYYEFKGGASYQLMSQLNVSLGVGSYQTYREGGDFVLPKNNDELRIWPQIVLSQSVGPFKIEQRYRLEMRYTSSGYRNRYRYRLGLSLPFGNDRKGYKPYNLQLSNELFFTNQDPYFERNRVLGAMGYKVSNQLLIQLGYIHQFDFRINDEIGRDFLVMGIFYELKRSEQIESIRMDN